MLDEPRNWKEVFYPQGLAFDGDDALFVSTTNPGNGHQVIKFRLSDGTELAASASGTVRFPSGLTIGTEGVYVYAQAETPLRGEIVVLDELTLGHSFAIQTDDRNVGQLVLHGTELFCTDQENHQIAVFDATGSRGLLRTIGSSGSAPGQFESPSGLAISNGIARSAEVLMIVGERSRIQVLTVDGQPRQVIHVPNAVDLACIALCPSGSRCYAASALGLRAVFEFELVKVSSEVSRFSFRGQGLDFEECDCGAQWGSARITGLSRGEQQQQLQQQLQASGCVIQ